MIDNSPEFIVNEQTGESVSISIPNILPSAIGVTTLDTLFTTLDEIDVTSHTRASDSLQFIDRAIDALRQHLTDILDFQASYALPYGLGRLTGLNGAGFSLHEDGLLPAGIRVGPAVNFEDDPITTQTSQVFRDLEQSGFVGVRVPIREGWIYGWLGIEVNHDSSFTITDYAWNAVPNDPVITGVASNRRPPAFDCNLDNVVSIADANCANVEDLDTLLTELGTRRGDADGSDGIAFADFLILAEGFGKPGEYTDGDFDKDGQVQFRDFLLFAQNFPKGVVSAEMSVQASVPEPGDALPLLSIIFIGGALLSRRKPS